MPAGTSMFDANDPLAAAIAPPPNETSEEKRIRLQNEEQARLVSEAIDADITRERNRLKKEKPPVRVLLLGQSESGKSTTLKNFRIKYAPDQWDAEQASWRTVIQLNLVTSINLILGILNAELASQPRSPKVPSRGFTLMPNDTSVDNPTSPSPSPSSSSPSASSSNLLEFTDNHRLLELRLRPLQGVERDLKRALATLPDGSLPDVMLSSTTNDPSRPPSPFSHTPLSRVSSRSSATSIEEPARRRSPEFFVRSIGNALAHKPRPAGSGGSGRFGRNYSREANSRPGTAAEGSTGNDVPNAAPFVDEATEIITQCAEDMKSLWQDKVVRMMLSKRGILMETSGGFFLNDIERIATRSYAPSGDDVIRARLKTVGVQEHEFVVQNDAGVVGKGVDNLSSKWIIYDVGGSRSSRAAWIPYFSSATAIIFLAPVSAMDEVLQEDPRMNRLEDSVLLWKMICASPLLAKTMLILFLNKCDLLEKKIRAGLKVKKWLQSFGDRPNETDHVIKYLKTKFKEIHKEKTPSRDRVSYIYATSVTNTKTTANTLTSVRDGILREHLQTMLL